MEISYEFDPKRLDLKVIVKIKYKAFFHDYEETHAHTFNIRRDNADTIKAWIESVKMVEEELQQNLDKIERVLQEETRESIISSEGEVKPLNS